MKRLSCTDTACSWTNNKDALDKKYKSALENYKPLPLEDHPCFSESPPTSQEEFKSLMLKSKQSTNSCGSYGNALSESNKPIIFTEESKIKKVCQKSKTIKRVKPANDLSDEANKTIKDIFFGLKQSSLVKAKEGRHGPIEVKEFTKVSDQEREVYRAIFANQDSNLMEMVKLFNVGPIEECCQLELQKLYVDGSKICEKTRNWISEWIKERSYRVTGSISRGLVTYTRNKNPDWKKKAMTLLNRSHSRLQLLSLALNLKTKLEKFLKPEILIFKLLRLDSSFAK